MSKFNGLKALIVEDDASEQFITKKLLDAEGIAYQVVGDGMEAWNVLKSKEFSFIMMDIKMPQHDGIEIVQWIREETDSYYKNIPIFALTNFSTSGYTQQVKKAGMNEHLTKPLEIGRLIECLEKYFPAK